MRANRKVFWETNISLFSEDISNGETKHWLPGDMFNYITLYENLALMSCSSHQSCDKVDLKQALNHVIGDQRA